MKYFRLHPWVFLIKGYCRGLIINTLDQSVLWINSELYNLLSSSEMNQRIPEEYLDRFSDFKKMNLGSFYKYPVAIDKLRIFNVFNEKKFHKNTPKIEIAVLHLTNNCDINCLDCSDKFCGSCVKLEENEKDITKKEWFNIIEELKTRGLKGVVLTGGEPILYESFYEIVDYLIENNISTTIQTHGLIRIDRKYDSKVNIIVSLYKLEHLKEITSNYKEIHRYLILNMTGNLIENSVENADIKTISHKITKTSLKGLNLSDYYIRKTYDNCLKNKMYISHSGAVYPCFQSRIKIKQFHQDFIKQIIETLVEDYWKINIEFDEKCSMCEFRYNCNKCKFFRDEDCAYDMEDGVWN
ncbi:radical SAM protein [Enterococcus faecalis]|uniref:radical SAM protein n=1 Tax=Enterococcus faecalis TaxID=1351 RepID=UPI00338E8F02